MVTTRRSAAREAAAAQGEGTPAPASPAPSSTPLGSRTPASGSKAANGSAALQSSTKAAQSSGAKQQHHSYEFFGPHGPLLLTFVLPAVVYGLFFGCNRRDCLSLWPRLHIPSALPKGLHWYSWEAQAVYCAWFFGLLALHLLLPGKKVQGVQLPNGERLTYKLNAFTLWALTYGASFALAFLVPASAPWHLNLSWLVDNYLPLLTASIVYSVLQAFYLYASSFKQGVLLSEHGTSGWWWYDFWMGRELNPRIGGYDWKEFCELYPGMIGWSILNLAFAHKQYLELGRVTNTVVLVNLFQLYYVLDALWFESSILTTMDIITDGFGYMLSLGDLVWVPFVFTTATRYLVDYPRDLSWAGVVAVVAVKLVGYYIFRGANEQKGTFRRDPNHPSVRHLKTLPTERGTKLIVSGWWGLSRHINYLGDWIMGVSWCLPCGLDGLVGVIPYFYCIYFATLLIHRERRDDVACKAKYGKDWDKYCQLVPYRIIPYVY